MGEDLFTSLTMENYPSTFLSMDSIANCHEDSFLDINLPLSIEQSPHPQNWNLDLEMLDVGLGPQINGSEKPLELPKIGKKCSKKLDSLWGAWFFFSFYFKPVLKVKSKSTIVLDGNGISGFEKGDLELDVFLVQHDMENIYMWVFKERPDGALGKMQLRSYMNGHSRNGQPPFPFSPDRGFVRSHKMQRKHYRGLSNPQCIHGIELVAVPNLSGLDEEDRKKWAELTGRDLSFRIPPEAKDFGSWRNLFELERPIKNCPPGKKLLNGSGLNLSSNPVMTGSELDFSSALNKKRKDLFPHGNEEECFLNGGLQDREFQATEPYWLSEFSGVMRNVYGPVTAAKTIYEDEEGYLILVSLPFADPERVKVRWLNTLSHGVVKVSSVSNACAPVVRRNDRVYKLTDPNPEHCPPGEFVRAIPLPTRIPDDAELEAYFDKNRSVLEIKVPKHRVGPEEHEVTVSLRPPPNEFVFS